MKGKGNKRKESNGEKRDVENKLDMEAGCEL